MAQQIHYVTVMIASVSKSTGKVLFKDDATNRLSDYFSTVSEHRVVADSAVASSATNPTVKQYLELEAAAGYKLQYMDQNKIVTYFVG